MNSEVVVRGALRRLLGTSDQSAMFLRLGKPIPFVKEIITQDTRKTARNATIPQGGRITISRSSEMDVT